MSKDDLRNLRQKLGVSKKGNTLVGHATPSPPDPPAQDDEQEEPVFDGGENTLQLSSSDIELIEETGGGAIVEADLEDEPPLPDRSLTPPPPPRKPDRVDRTGPPEPPLARDPSWPGPMSEVAKAPADQAEPTSEPVEEAPPPTVIAVAEDERELYVREAEALADELPERAGLMQIEAARVLGEGGEPTNEQLDAALEQAPSSPQVVALAREALLRTGQQDRVLDLTERLIELGGDNKGRVAALLEAALITHRRKDRSGAVALLDRALDLQPGLVPALALRALLHQSLKQHRRAAETLEQLAESLGEPRERALVLVAAGSVYEHELDNTERAEQDYQRAAENDPKNPFALLALRDLHLVQGNWRELARDLERIADLASDAGTRARYLHSAGALHLDRTADLEAAARTLKAAADAAPDALAPLTRLAHVYEETGRYQELVETLLRQLDLVRDPRGKPALLCRIGWLLHHRLGQTDRATEHYRQALALQPAYLPALVALSTIHRQRGDHDGLVAILTPETEGTDTTGWRAVLCLEAAELCANRLQRPEDAVGFYRRALELSPSMWVAFWRLEHLLTRLQRFDALAALIKQRSELARDPRTRNYLLLQLARLQAGPLNEIDQAIETMRQARAGGECRVAAVELAELYARSGQHGELVGLLLSEAGDTSDPQEARGRRLQAAALLDEKLGEHDRALEIYREVLEQDPGEKVALHAAGRLYHRLGRWKDLLDLHRHELEVEPDRDDAAELLYRIGRLYEVNLGQPDDAVAAYMEALERDPSSTVALESVVGLVRSENRRRELVDMLERHAAVLSEPPAGADALCRAAEIAHAYLNDPGRAARLYRAALERSPDFRDALQGLLDLRLRQKKWEEAATLLEQLIAGAATAADRAKLCFRLARLREHCMKEAPSLELYDAAAEASPYGALLRLEQLRARWCAGEQVNDALETAAQAAADDALAGALWLVSALLHEAGQKHERQLAAAEQAFALDGESVGASRCLQRALWRVSEHTVLAALLERQAETEPDRVLRLSQLCQAARAHLRSNAPAEARRLAGICLELEPDHLPALSLMARLAAGDEQWGDLADLQDRLARACRHPGNRLHAALQAADLWAHRVRDRERALASLQPALADNPGQPEAFARAERLLQQNGKHEQLSKLYTRRIVASEDPAEKIELLRLHARLLHHKLGDAAAAIAELGKLLALRPGDLAALSERADLLCSQGRWSDAATTLETLVERTDDTDQRRHARLLQAQVWLNQLNKPARARGILDQALADEPDNVSVKQGLVQVAFAEGKWDEARQLLDEIAAQDQPHLQVWALTRLAEVAHVGLRDEELRGNYEREALLLAGANPPVLEQVIDRYRERREQKRLIKVASDVLQETTRAEVASTMRLALARVMLEDMKQPAQALDWLREGLVRDPNDTTTNLLYARALEQQGELEQAVARYRQLLERAPLTAEAYRGLGRLGSLMGHQAVSVSALAVLELLDAASPRELEMLEELAPGVSPGGQLEVTAMPAPAALHPLRRVFNLVLPHLGSVYPLQLGRALRPTEPPALFAGRLATAIGLTGVQVAVEGDVPAAAGVGDPVPLQVAPDLASEPRSARFRFWVGRALAFAALGGSLTEQLPDRELGELFEALFVQRPIDAVVAQLRKQAMRAIPRKTRKALEQLEPPRSDADYWKSYRLFVRRRSDEVGLLLCGDPRVALAELTGGDGSKLEGGQYRQLLNFMVSEEYGNFYRSLWSSTLTG